MLYLEVAVASPIANTLTYSHPKHYIDKLCPGIRLLVPLGRQQVTGYLLTISESCPESKFKLKNITDILDDTPLFPESMIPFFRWLAEYYHYPIGEIIKGALPNGLTQKMIRTIELTTNGSQAINSYLSTAKKTPPWAHSLLEKGGLNATETKKAWRSSKTKTQLHEWQTKGYLHISEQISKDAARDKTETCISLTENSLPTTELKSTEQKTITTIKEISFNKNNNYITKRDLTKAYSGARKSLITLTDKGYVSVFERKVYRDPFGECPPFYPEPKDLTAEQTSSLATIIPALDNRKFSTFLLHGITGSGKTEVYLKATAHSLTMGRAVLILVPEIALATQLEGNFLSRFGDKVALLHSGLSTGERLDQWKRVCQGKARVVIGARSALFAPLNDLGLIIVDEEHDGAFKQDEGFRYQGRDAAILRGSLAKATVVLGTATPSVTSYFHAENKKYSLIEMKKRVANRQLPTVKVIDLKKINTTTGRPPLFSPELIKALKENFAAGNQSLVFLNRRGYANLMLCRDCGTAVQCQHCNVSLTLHQESGQLICHYCGYSIDSKVTCANCQSTKLIPVGSGTEKVEDELRRILPRANIARLDRDTANNRKAYMKILNAVHNREIDILVGTQMITKGHHFPHVTLVGVVWADAGLGIPDFKSAERTFQLLTQVFGRAGRGEKPGKVIVQTHYPEHYSINTSRDHDYNTLYKEEIRIRKALDYPPFSRLINIRLEGKSNEAVQHQAQALALFAQKHRLRDKVKVLGPASAPISRMHGLFRWHLMLKGNQHEIHLLCTEMLQTKLASNHRSAVKITVDVDPENML